MRIRYQDEALRRLAQDPDFAMPSLGHGVIRAYRKTIQRIAAATSEHDLHALRGLRLKPLHGDREGQSSMRLNDQYRLIVRFETDGQRTAVVIEVVDYH